MRYSRIVLLTSSVMFCFVCSQSAMAGDPTQLLPGEAPVLLTSSEGADAGNETILRDGQLAVGDDIWLWVPALDLGGMVDLVATGQFFKIWDSGNAAENPGNFNDDDANGMRGMDFDHSTGTFLVSYEDTTTTGFSFGSILDGDLMRMTPTTVTNGRVTAFTLSRIYNECANGTTGCIGTGDITAIDLADDATLYYGPGGTQTIKTDLAGTVDVGPSTLVHVDGITGFSPENLGATIFFEAGLMNCPIIFCPAIITGQLRGADVLNDGLVTFGVSGDWQNTQFTGSIDGLTDKQAEALAIGYQSPPVCLKADICSVPDYNNNSLNTYQRRTAAVLYAGSLFFQTPNVGDAEMLDHDIIDTQQQLAALITTLGAKSSAGIALSAHLEKKNPCAPECVTPGVIDVFDLFAMLSNWNADGCGADFAPPNNIVDVFDLFVLLSIWGDCP